jgi:uncharacterized protein YunC (DUF1805 family)
VIPIHVVVLDSITQVSVEHAGLCVVTGSHGGVSAASYAQAVAARVYVFNDAGVGKDRAGLAALALLDAQGIAAVAVSHNSARIGDARDTWESGEITAVNTAAQRLGLRRGEPVRRALAALPPAAD